MHASYVYMCECVYVHRTRFKKRASGTCRKHQRRGIGLTIRLLVHALVCACIPRCVRGCVLRQASFKHIRSSLHVCRDRYMCMCVFKEGRFIQIIYIFVCIALR